MIPYVKIYADEFEQLCYDDETLIDAISVEYAGGLEIDGTESNEMSIGICDGVDIPAVDRLIQRSILGKTLDIRNGSQASVLATRLGRMSFLALTTTRLFIVEDLHHDNRRVTWMADLDEVKSLRCSPHLMLGLGRIRMQFHDGSMIRLRAGLLVPVAAIRFTIAYRRLTRS